MSSTSSYITADARNLKEILAEKYEVDVFQREYRWGKENIVHLIEDLSSKFFENYEFRNKHDRKEVKSYSKYYMGSIILNVKDNILSIIDGQQRLTSLTLLLIFLNNLQKDKNLNEPLDQLIADYAFGTFSLNLQIEDREECMLELFRTGDYDVNNVDDVNESVKNIVERYDDISALVAELSLDDALPYFIDWLKENVMFVVIKTWSDDDAYKIFETMNDRGLSLTPPEMLKGHLLSKFSEDNEKKKLNELWKKRMSKIKDLDKNVDMEFIQSWFRAKYAETIKQHAPGAHDEDFEIIGTKPHRWLKDKQDKIGLSEIDDYRKFIEHNFVFFSKIYEKIYNAAHNFDKNLEHVFYIEYCRFAHSLSFPLLMSPIMMSDDEKTVDTKINLVAKYLESFIIRRKVNGSSIGQTTVRIRMYQLVKEIRDKSVDELAKIFAKNITDMKENIDEVYEYGLEKMNKSFVKFLLARITSHIEEKSGIPNSNFEMYVKRERKNRFEIEHIWANKFMEHKDEFENESDFDDYRNSLGGLILIPRGINQSYGALPYSEKLEHYYGQNLLAQSLNSKCYAKNPGFLQYIKESGLPFKHYEQFTKKSIDERQKLYQKICEELWSTDELSKILKINN